MTKCVVLGCRMKAVSKQMCRKHYNAEYNRRRRAQKEGKVVSLVPDAGKQAEPPAPTNLTEEKLREEIVSLRLKNQEKAGTLLRAEEVKQEWLAHLATVRTGLEAAPAWLKTHCTEPVSPAVMAVFREWIDVFVSDLGIELGPRT